MHRNIIVTQATNCSEHHHVVIYYIINSTHREQRHKFCLDQFLWASVFCERQYLLYGSERAERRTERMQRNQLRVSVCAFHWLQTDYPGVAYMRRVQLRKCVRWDPNLSNTFCLSYWWVSYLKDKQIRRKVSSCVWFRLHQGSRK